MIQKKQNHNTHRPCIGIIGGTGLDDPRILHHYDEVQMVTPYGSPSSVITRGTLENADVAIISRHGKNHAIMPSCVPYRANLWSLYKIGCTHIFATTACGSLKENYRPGEFVFFDQFIDFTKYRTQTFFQDQVIHTPMADPTCKTMRSWFVRAAQALDITYHDQGTIVTIEGPRFSTRAESKMFQLLGADIINMSTVPEAVLCRELGMCYQGIAMITDYDCWKAGEKSVTWEIIQKRMDDNSLHVKNLLKETLRQIPTPLITCCGTRPEIEL